MGRRYIVKQRARIDTITGPVNLPYGTTVEAVEDYLIHQGRPDIGHHQAAGETGQGPSTALGSGVGGSRVPEVPTPGA